MTIMSTQIEIPEAYLDAGHILAQLQDGKLKIVQGRHRAKSALDAGMKPRVKQLDDLFWRVDFVMPQPKRFRRKGPVRRAFEAEIATRPGCLAMRRARTTGTVVGLYKSLASGIESDPDHSYTTVCEDHGSCVCHATRADAKRAMSYPNDWCDDCRDKES